MSTNHTPNLNLPQWEGSDRILREEFNDAMQKIDAGVMATQDMIPRIVTGSYVGTGTSGKNAPTTITFPFEPKLVLISGYQTSPGGRNGVVGWFRGFNTGVCDFDCNSETVKLTWSGNTLSFYSDENYNAVFYQLNREGTTYHYLAIG